MSDNYPLLEAVAVGLLTSSGHRAGITTPGDLEKLPEPYHKVTRGPGGDDGVTDAPLLDIETFARTRFEAAGAAEDVRQVIHAARGRLFDDVETASGPTHLDYRNQAVSRYVHSYRVGLRRAPDIGGDHGDLR